MKLYRIKLHQTRPVEVWTEDYEKAFKEALDESEWDDDFERIDING